MKKYILLLLFFAAIKTGFAQFNCDPPTNLTASVNMQDITLSWSAPSLSQFLVLGEGPRNIGNSIIDVSPEYKGILNLNPSRDYLDVQFTFPCYFADGEAGVESDGSFIYSSKWKGARFACYNFDGSLVDSFNIIGVDKVRDMAFCETDGYMYGTEPVSGIDSSRIYKMDFNTRTLIDVLYIPDPVRTLAYDPDLDVFYSNNWDSDVMVIDRLTGNILDTIPLTGTYGSYYGFAYDNWSTDGPFIWGFSQDGSGMELVQLNLPDFSETGFVMDLSSLSATGVGYAGGLFTQAGIIEGTVTLGGLIQNELIFGLELAEVSPPPPIPELAGYNIYRDGSLQNTSLVIDTTFFDSALSPGTYQYQVTAVYEDTLGAFVCESDSAGPASAIVEEFLLLGGNVFAGTYKLDEGKTYGYISDGDNITLQHTAEIDEFGYFFFYPCESRDYYVISKPSINSSYYNDYIPTYYGDVYHWENSPTVFLQANMYNADIYLIQITQSNTGSGRICGTVYFENTDIISSPASNIQLLLLNNSNECISIDYSDEQGYFCFDQLENGTYKLLCEIIGKKMTPQVFIIDNYNHSFEGISLIINEDEIVMGINDDLPGNIRFLSDVFPNPANNYANIEIGVIEEEIVKVTLYSTTGKVIDSYVQKLQKGLNRLTISTKDLSQGIYFVNIEFENTFLITKKFISCNN